MFELFMNITSFVSPIFYKILYMSIVGTAIGIIIITITKLFDTKLSAKWKYLLFLIPLLFLMIPITRIQINTNNEFVLSSVVDKVESSLNNVETISYTRKGNLQDIATNETESKQESELNVAKQTNLNNANQNDKSIIYTILPTIWLLGTSVSLLIFVAGNIGIKHKISKTIKLDDNGIKLILMRCKQRLQISKKIEIRLQNFNASPCIYGLIHPKILVSEDFIKSDSQVIQNVFMHELSHYKRKDMITNYILLIMMSLHWFNPFVYVFFRKIRQEMELATDEIALSKMNKEEKKAYGLTLISLLQTCQTEKVASKMLCITDDSKNMERRIEKIKWSTKLKKYRASIIIFVIAILICALSPFIIKLNSETSNKISKVDEETLYETVKQYLIKKEEENHYLERKEFATNGDDFKTFIDMAKLGTQKNGEETYVYVWALIESYSVQEELTSSGSSMPYRFTIKDGSVIDCQIPEDGEGYEKSIEKIFPKEIREKIKDSENLVNQEKLEAEAEKYYEYLGNNGEFINTNIEKSTIDKVVGKWKPYKAEYKGKEINLRDVYGSGITYGGELILNKDNTYTEFIGVYSEDNVNDLQGTFRTYGSGEKALLTTNNGETKTLEVLESGENSIIVLTNSDGTRIYFTK